MTRTSFPPAGARKGHSWITSTSLNHQPGCRLVISDSCACQRRALLLPLL